MQAMCMWGVCVCVYVGGKQKELRKWNFSHLKKKKKQHKAQMQHFSYLMYTVNWTGDSQISEPQPSQVSHYTMWLFLLNSAIQQKYPGCLHR